jgi:hypothetical protein
MKLSLNPMKLFGLIGTSSAGGDAKKATGVRHDCRRAGWGHSCNLDNSSRVLVEQGRGAGLFYRCNGHLSPKVRVGDQVIVAFGRGPTVCQFTKVSHADDPADMYFGTVKVLGYLADIEATQVTHEVSESAKIALEGRTRTSHPKQWARGNGAEPGSK